MTLITNCPDRAGVAKLTVSWSPNRCGAPVTTRTRPLPLLASAVTVAVSGVVMCDASPVMMMLMSSPSRDVLHAALDGSTCSLAVAVECGVDLPGGAPHATHVTANRTEKAVRIAGPSRGVWRVCIACRSIPAVERDDDVGVVRTRALPSLDELTQRLDDVRLHVEPPRLDGP